MAFVRKVLACMVVPATKSDIYVPTTGKMGLIHNWTIHNTNTSSETVQLFYNNGTEFKQFNIVITPGDTAIMDFGNEGFIVAVGAKITGMTSNANKVNLKFDGTEEG